MSLPIGSGSMISINSLIVFAELNLAWREGGYFALYSGLQSVIQSGLSQPAACT